MEQVPKVTTTLRMREDHVEWARRSRRSKRLNLSALVEKLLDEYIPKADLLIIQQQVLRQRLSVTSQEMEQVDKYGATKA